jgi:osmotically-inducible protein OsmY
VPSIVLLDVAETHRSVRALYHAGATAVLRWPRKPGVLATVLAETLGIARVRGPARRVDAALARTVRAHLRLFGGTTPGLRVSVREGVVHLGGSVPSLERKQEVVRVVSGVAGVTGADSTALHVIPMRRVPDRQVRESVVAVLRAASEHGAPKVAAVVQSGHVTLTGELPTRRDLARVEDLVSRVHGVRSIRSQIRFTRRSSRPDHVVRSRLQARLRAAFPGAELSVSVFSGVAVITGRAERLATKHAAARIVGDDDDVKRVLDAVQVV